MKSSLNKEYNLSHMGIKYHNNEILSKKVTFWLAQAI